MFTSLGSHANPKWVLRCDFGQKLTGALMEAEESILLGWRGSPNIVSTVPIHRWLKDASRGNSPLVPCLSIYKCPVCPRGQNIILGRCLQRTGLRHAEVITR